MKLIEKTKEVLAHPLTATAGAIGAVGSLVNVPVPVLDALIQTVWVNAGTVFAGVSLSASQGWIPKALVVGAGALFLGRIMDQLLDGFTARLKNDD